MHLQVCEKTHSDLAIALHDTDLDVLRSRLNDFQQTFDRQLDTLLPCEIVLVILLQKLPHSFG